MEVKQDCYYIMEIPNAIPGAVGIKVAASVADIVIGILSYDSVQDI